MINKIQTYRDSYKKPNSYTYERWYVYEYFCVLLKYILNPKGLIAIIKKIIIFV